MTHRAAVALVLFSSIVSSVRAQGMYDTTAFRTFEITFPTSNWLTPLINSKQTETYLKAELKFNGKVYKDVGVRSRGGSAYNAGRRNGKLPLKISFDEFVPGRKVMGVRSTVLNNGGFWSPTFMREVLILGLMREFVPTPEANFCQITINGKNHGVYINVETPNKDFLERYYENADGNRYKGRRSLSYRGSSPANYTAYYPLTSSATPNAYLDLIKALKTTTLTGSQAATEIPKLCNVEGALKVMACNVAFANGDSFPRHNYYLYLDPLHTQMEVIPWDVNLGFRRTSINTTQTFYAHTDLWKRWYRAHLRDLGETSLDWNEIGKDVAKWQALIDQAVRNDPLKFYTYQQFKDGITKPIDRIFTIGLRPSIEGLQRTIRNTLTGPRVTMSNHVRSPMDPKPNETVWINVTAKSTAGGVRGVNLHWRSVGHYRSLPMFDDGQHRDGKANDGVYGVSVPVNAAGAQVDYYFSAEESNLNISFLPIQTDYRPFRYRHLGPKLDSVLIHEVMASNTKGIKDEKNEFEDWIELYNPLASAVDVAGMFLSDDRTNLKKWKIPTGIVVPPSGTLLIWADNEPADGPLHATFKVSAGGEELYLTAKDGTTLLDYVEFGPQISDVSLARLRDRSDQVWVTHYTPTPAARNELSTCGMRRYGAKDHQSQPMSLTFTGTPKIATKVSIGVSGAPVNSAIALLLGLKIESFHFRPLGVDLLVDSVATTLNLPGSATGSVTLPITLPNDPNLHGLQLVLQGLSVDAGRVVASNAVQVEFCR